MKKMRFGCLFLILIFLLPVSLCAFDFGVLVNQYAAAGNSEGEDLVFEYNAGVVPRIELFFLDTGSFFTSVSAKVEYNNSLENSFLFVPEILRTEFSVRFGRFGIQAGRFNYSDPLSYIVNGLFDGVQFTHSSSAGRFSLGTWYTGLLYKNNANITMTKENMERSIAPLSYDDFFKTYFAPKRLIASIDWDHPSIGEFMRIHAAITGQMDLSEKTDNYTRLHSQYLTFKVDIPVSSFMIEAGASIEASQLQSQNQDDDFNLALLGDLGFYWTVPTNFNSRLSFSGRYASGDLKSDLFGAFTPVTTNYYGDIFKTKMSAVSVLALDYSARLHRTFGASLSASYFIRNDLKTQNIYIIQKPASRDNGNFLGGEFFARFVWNPFSDLQLNLGGGAFVPALGNRWNDEKARWKIDLTAVLSVY